MLLVRKKALRRRRTCLRWSSMAIALCLSTVIPTLRGEDASPLQREPAVAIEAAPRIAEIGDRIVIDIRVAIPAGATVEVPTPESRIGDFSVLEFDTVRISSPTGEPARVARIVTAVYRTGSFTFPSLSLRFKTVDGRESVARTEPFTVTIKSILPGKDPELKASRKQIDMREPIEWKRWLGLGLAAALAAALAWIVWRRLRRRRSVAPPPPAPPMDILDVAEAELHRLLERGPPNGAQAKELKEHYVALSGIIRRVLDAGYGVHTEEQTTSEIMDALRHTATPDAMAVIESFLQRSDIVKFAKYAPSAAEHEVMAKDAYRILADARTAVGRPSRVAAAVPPLRDSTGT